MYVPMYVRMYIVCKHISMYNTALMQRCTRSQPTHSTLEHLLLKTRHSTKIFEC